MSETNFITWAPKDTAWCPGCGDFGILAAVKDALDAMGKKPHEVLMAAGIGQAAKLPHYINGNGYCGLHGRSLPAAVGAKVANRDMTVIINSGDGDIYGEGGNHLLHTIRRNLDITLIVHNNQIYGLTQGQSSPTSEKGNPTKLQPEGVINEPLSGPALALTLGCNFVARSFSGDQKHLSHIIQQAVAHKGFSFVECLQPCVSMNKINTFKYYKDRAKDVADDDYQPTDRIKAIEKALQWGDTIPTGILYKNPVASPPFEDRLAHVDHTVPLVKQPTITSDQMKSLFKQHM